MNLPQRSTAAPAVRAHASLVHGGAASAAVIVLQAEGFFCGSFTTSFHASKHLDRLQPPHLSSPADLCAGIEHVRNFHKSRARLFEA